MRRAEGLLGVIFKLLSHNALNIQELQYKKPYRFISVGLLYALKLAGRQIKGELNLNLLIFL